MSFVVGFSKPPGGGGGQLMRFSDRTKNQGPEAKASLICGVRV